MKNALLILCLATLSVCADDFYIWQRDWNERVREAVRSERAAERFYFLEGELTAERFPRGFAAKKLTRGMIPVYRIHTSALRFSAEEIAEKIFDARFPEIQPMHLQHIKIDIFRKFRKLFQFQMNRKDGR